MDEYNAMLVNHTWELIPNTPDTNFVTSFKMMALLTDIKLIGFYVASHNVLALTSMRHLR